MRVISPTLYCLCKAECDFTVQVNLVLVEANISLSGLIYAIDASSVLSSCACMKINQLWRKQAKYYIYLIKMPKLRSRLSSRVLSSSLQHAQRNEKKCQTVSASLQH